MNVLNFCLSMDYPSSKLTIASEKRIPTAIKLTGHVLIDSLLHPIVLHDGYRSDKHVQTHREREGTCLRTDTQHLHFEPSGP